MSRHEKIRIYVLHVPWTIKQWGRKYSTRVRRGPSKAKPYITKNVDAVVVSTSAITETNVISAQARHRQGGRINSCRIDLLFTSIHSFRHVKHLCIGIVLTAQTCPSTEHMKDSVMATLDSYAVRVSCFSGKIGKSPLTDPPNSNGWNK